ncbi:hypothetical protein A2567_02100 [Candidatus Azambacteria bacterium RIFOXYD1_FULL_42_11]|uniref:ATP-dependent Clp protease proteolytic subunit n=4 Tax=Candidatus Azamiibacteriota TaxID=1752741 RepID=A0A0G0ZBD6_9BACT|nr:MAG: ATP-dependent Clp protease proteolytic subunit [Candidatus Azambacteria bacterium GW2011_GWB1_42_17]KKS45974.1 MAG: ATP-dependent Clp protease proteolytic subunit [Candidatus Azambacteria bacterium GW2011_GWA1_42_19]KKS75879.1 MAG: ATP-dependent Clp protease proteolytic subunit [Candidatus Azambacteria bacterium GW2011_GWA2_42_9]KKS88617.1 MAG: ATP-dependent Clp protease proteolytic subunit [Parcubacteria group bacterium GW2011_GWC1_43_11]OGD42934.1 MAG: hypothetical protein A2567_02100
MSWNKKNSDNEFQKEGSDSYISCNPQERKIYIRGDINSHASNYFAIGFDKMRSQKTLTVIDISSPGGNSIPGLDIYNKIRTSVCPVITMTFGTVCSAAFLIFLGGDKRIISREAMIRFHWPIGERNHEEINLDSTETDRDYYKKLFEHYCNIIANRTGLTLRDIRKYMRYSRMFDGKQALKMGIATAIFEDKFPNKNKKGRK